MRTVMHHTFEAAAARCWDMFHDPASHVAKFEGMGHHVVTVLEKDQTDDELRIVVTREVDVEGIPGFAERFVKPRHTVVSTDYWQDRDDGTYGGEFTLDTKGAPVEISGTTLLTPDGDRTHYQVTVDIEVKVPLLGGKLAEFSKKIVERQLTQEFALGDSWLASRSPG